MNCGCARSRWAGPSPARPSRPGPAPRVVRSCHPARTLLTRARLQTSKYDLSLGETLHAEASRDAVAGRQAAAAALRVLGDRRELSSAAQPQLFLEFRGAH